MEEENYRIGLYVSPIVMIITCLLLVFFQDTLIQVIVILPLVNISSLNKNVVYLWIYHNLQMFEFFDILRSYIMSSCWYYSSTASS